MDSNNISIGIHFFKVLVQIHYSRSPPWGPTLGCKFTYIRALKPNIGCNSHPIGPLSYASGLCMRPQPIEMRAPTCVRAQFGVLLRNTPHNYYGRKA